MGMNGGVLVHLEVEKGLESIEDGLGGHLVVVITKELPTLSSIAGS